MVHAPRVVGGGVLFHEDAYLVEVEGLHRLAEGARRIGGYLAAYGRYFAQLRFAPPVAFQRRQTFGLDSVTLREGLHTLADDEQRVKVYLFLVVSGDCRIKLRFAREYLFAQTFDAVADEPFIAGGDFAPAAHGLFVDVKGAVVAQSGDVGRNARKPLFVVGAPLPVGADDLFEVLFVFGQQPELVVFAGVDGLELAVEDGPADVGGEDAAAYLAARVAND